MGKLIPAGGLQTRGMFVAVYSPTSRIMNTSIGFSKGIRIFSRLFAPGGLMMMLFFGCNQNADPTDIGTDTADPKTREVVAATGEEPIPSSVTDAWGNIDYNSPALSYAELNRNKDVKVRGTDNFAIYDLGEDIIFDKGQSVIRKDAAKSLASIGMSIKQRFPGGPIRLYGFAEDQSSAVANKQLATARAAAVRDWMVSHNYVTADRITIEPVGENDSGTSPETMSEKKIIRRVQIVVREAIPK